MLLLCTIVLYNSVLFSLSISASVCFGQDSSVGKAADLDARGPGFNTWPGLTQPSIPLWLGKMSTQQTYANVG